MSSGRIRRGRGADRLGLRRRLLHRLLQRRRLKLGRRRGDYGGADFAKLQDFRDVLAIDRLELE